jgi:alpha-1,2-rhamnosyltransferase
MNSDKKFPRSCYVDCTATLLSGANSGIPRVVRNIICRLECATRQHGVHFVPVVATQGQFYKAVPKHRLLATHALRALLVSCRNLLDLLFQKKRASSDTDELLFEAHHPPRDTHLQLIRAARQIIPCLYKLTYRLDGLIRDWQPVVFQSQDILFLPDAFWERQTTEAVLHTKSLPFRRILLIHDIIAITEDDVFEARHRKLFQDAFRFYTELCDGILCVSKTALREVSAYVHTTLQLHRPCDFAYLGADFAAKGERSGEIRQSFAVLFSRMPLYIMVGTLEPRKNHLCVLSVFEKLWAAGVNISLCFIGRIGWQVDSLIARIKSNQGFGNRLLWVSDCNDSELEFAYQHAKAVIFASKNEGFGLPLIEAMHYGKPVFASDIPIFREIGGEYPHYFSLKDPDTLATAICDFENSRLELAKSPMLWHSWDEAVDNLLGKVLELAESPVK